ncbi:iron-sulfur cluster transfer protein NUBPL [Planococcus citri]|uniref:iron-sulfur cluster transfer protein NUBPL n=1 Tax=Planococcus citri TaxID=170843 RepID=UPI0031FA3DED
MSPIMSCCRYLPSFTRNPISVFCYHGLRSPNYVGCRADQIHSSSKRSNHSQSKILSKGLPKKKPITGVKQIVLVASGKGGVGKSTISVNLAVALKKLQPEKEVGLLDADVFGPSIPLMMNLHDTPLLTNDDLMKPLVNYGVKCISMGNIITENSAAIWRGLMVMSALDKLIRQVDWNPVDYMVIDTPPGTGDTHLSLAQNLPISGALVVSTGQKASLQIARRGITMLNKLQIPVFGIVHNMSSVICTKCSHKTPLFGDYFEEFSKENDIEILENVPLDGSVSDGCDSGVPVVISHPESFQAKSFVNLASTILKKLQTSS